jgi:hypothetical protein
VVAALTMEGDHPRAQEKSYSVPPNSANMQTSLQPMFARNS